MAAYNETAIAARAEEMLSARIAAGCFDALDIPALDAARLDCIEAAMAEYERDMRAGGEFAGLLSTDPEAA